MKSNSNLGPDPSRYHAGVQAAGIGAAGAISSALAVGILNAMNDNALQAGRQITLEEWQATVNFLEAWCQRYDRDLRAEKKDNGALRLENLRLHAELEIARFRATTRH